MTVLEPITHCSIIRKKVVFRLFVKSPTKYNFIWIGLFKNHIICFDLTSLNLQIFQNALFKNPNIVNRKSFLLKIFYLFSSIIPSFRYLFSSLPFFPSLSPSQVQSAAALLLESKMFYVPFLLNSTIQRQYRSSVIVSGAD